MRKYIKKITLTVFLLGFSLGLAFITYCLMLLPSIKTLDTISFEEPTTVYSKHHVLIDSYGGISRMPVQYSKIPKQLINAFIAIEDKNFFMHSGVEIKSLLRAIYVLIKTGKKQQGGSTITMQVARNFYLTRQKTYYRKILEILLAFKIEYSLTKQEILYLYVNKIFFGNHAYGIKAAAKIYYGKSLDELTLAQSAMIAGLPKAPSRINPLNNPVKAKKRRTRVLKAMLREHYITKEEFTQANQAPLTAKYHRLPKRRTTPYIHGLIQDELEKIFKDNPIPKSIKIYTTVNDSIQKAAVQSLQLGILNYAKNSQKHAINHIAQPEARIHLLQQYPTYQNLFPAVITQITDAHLYLMTKKKLILLLPLITQYNTLRQGDVVYLYQKEKKYFISNLPILQGALVSIQPSNGAIRAIVGGFSSQLSSFNRATQTQLQPGSTLKPFIYAAALNYGFTAASLINDAPFLYKINSQKMWRPKNHNQQFSGPITLRKALVKSKNLVSVRLLNKIGIHKTRKFLTRFGFKEKQLPKHLSLALGAAHMSPLELTTAYSALINGGNQIQPYVIETILDKKNNILYKHQAQNKQIIDPRDSFIITDILKEVLTKGTGKAARILKRDDIGGKTGTTNNLLDNWFIGHAPTLATAVWIGFDNPQPINLYAAQTALPIWIHFMHAIKKDIPVIHEQPPANLVQVAINRKTGLRVENNSPMSYMEYFKKQTAPTLSNTKQPDINLSNLF